MGRRALCGRGYCIAGAELSPRPWIVLGVDLHSSPEIGSHDRLSVYITLHLFSSQ